MNADRRKIIQRSLASLAQSNAANMQLLEQTLSLVCEELSLNPWSYFYAHVVPRDDAQPARADLVIDAARFSVHFRGRNCFLGNTLPFRLLARLAQRPDTYVSHEDLLAEVWEGVRSEGAVRAVVKTLRQRLRRAGLGELADAIDGTVRGHYALRLDR
jgi:DNA-binding response OmpR family regulator